MKKSTVGILVLLLCSPLLAQEASDSDKDRQWVTDQLRLSLYEKADAQSRIIRYLSSGDVLDIEQLSGAYAFVTAADGTKGWVKRGFLVTKPTATLRLKQEQEKTKQLEVEIEKLSNSKIIIDQYEKDMDLLVEKIDDLQEENQKSAESIAELQQELEAKDLKFEQQATNSIPATTALWDAFTNYWEVVIPIIIGIVLLSFVASKEIIETRIKKKFHGIKIW